MRLMRSGQVGSDETAPIDGRPTALAAQRTWTPKEIQTGWVQSAKLSMPAAEVIFRFCVIWKELFCCKGKAQTVPGLSPATIAAGSLLGDLVAPLRRHCSDEHQT